MAFGLPPIEDSVIANDWALRAATAHHELLRQRGLPIAVKQGAPPRSKGFLVNWGHGFDCKALD